MSQTSVSTQKHSAMTAYMKAHGISPSDKEGVRKAWAAVLAQLSEDRRQRREARASRRAQRFVGE